MCKYNNILEAPPQIHDCSHLQRRREENGSGKKNKGDLNFIP